VEGFVQRTQKEGGEIIKDNGIPSASDGDKAVSGTGGNTTTEADTVTDIDGTATDGTADKRLQGDEDTESGREGRNASVKWMRHVVIAGAPRSGKTTLASELFSQMYSGIFLDIGDEPENEYYSGIKVFTNTDECIRYVFEGKLAVLKCYPHNVKDILYKICKIQTALEEKQPVTIVIDEAHLCFPHGTVRLNPDEPPNIVTLALTNGLRWNVRLMFLTQRVQLMDSNVFRLCETKVFFYLDGADRTYLRRECKLELPEMKRHPDGHSDYIIL